MNLVINAPRQNYVFIGIFEELNIFFKVSYNHYIKIYSAFSIGGGGGGGGGIVNKSRSIRV